MAKGQNRSRTQFTKSRKEKKNMKTELENNIDNNRSVETDNELGQNTEEEVGLQYIW